MNKYRLIEKKVDVYSFLVLILLALLWWNMKYTIAAMRWWECPLRRTDFLLNDGLVLKSSYEWFSIEKPIIAKSLWIKALIRKPAEDYSYNGKL